jgi:hypothetical protein
MDAKAVLGISYSNTKYKLIEKPQIFFTVEQSS